MTASIAPTLYCAEVDVRWGDLDADGVVNNVLVLRFIEEARMQWAQALELHRSDPGSMSVVARLACTYLKPIAYPARLRVDIRCEKLGTRSLDLSFDVIDAKGDSLFAQASITWVWVDKATRRATPMPGRLREVCDRPD
jgi:acyl-CoA thioester hydrolase